MKATNEKVYRCDHCNRPNCIKEGDKILFTSGNYQGMTAVVSKVDFASENKNAIYGYYNDVILSNGKVGHIEKSEHWVFL